MTTDGIINILLAVAVPGLMALIGGVLAARTLPTPSGKRNPEVYIWSSLLVALFLISVVLAFVQQVRTSYQQEVNEKKAATDKLIANGETKYTQGQLDSINKVMASLVSAKGGDPDTKSILQALLQSTSKQSTPTLTASSPELAHIKEDLRNARDQVEILETEWTKDKQDIRTEINAPYTSGQLKGQPPDQLPDKLSRRITDQEKALLDRYKALKPLIDKANKEALEYMRLTPEKKAGLNFSFQLYSQLAEGITKFNTPGDLTSSVGMEFHDRFRPMVGYLKSLLDELALY